MIINTLTTTKQSELMIFLGYIVEEITFLPKRLLLSFSLHTEEANIKLVSFNIPGISFQEQNSLLLPPPRRFLGKVFLILVGLRLVVKATDSDTIVTAPVEDERMTTRGKSKDHLT